MKVQRRAAVVFRTRNPIGCPNRPLHSEPPARAFFCSCPCLGAWPHTAVMRCNAERATRPLGNTMVNNANSAFLSDWACADLRWPSAWPQSQLRISGETALSAPPTAGRIGCARGNRECAVPTTLIENYVQTSSSPSVLAASSARLVRAAP